MELMIGPYKILIIHVKRSFLNLILLIYKINFNLRILVKRKK